MCALFAPVTQLPAARGRRPTAALGTDSRGAPPPGTLPRVAGCLVRPEPGWEAVRCRHPRRGARKSWAREPCRPGTRGHRVTNGTDYYCRANKRLLHSADRRHSCPHCVRFRLNWCGGREA